MKIDEDRIDNAVFELLWPTLRGRDPAWKGQDWDALGRLHDEGMILDPVGKAKSVVLTEEGLRESKRLFEALFARKRSGDAASTKPSADRIAEERFVGGVLRRVPGAVAPDTGDRP